jgi:hypothetical protein
LRRHLLRVYAKRNSGDVFVLYPIDSLKTFDFVRYAVRPAKYDRIRAQNQKISVNRYEDNRTITPDCTFLLQPDAALEAIVVPETARQLGNQKTIASNLHRKRMSHAVRLWERRRKIAHSRAKLDRWGGARLKVSVRATASMNRRNPVLKWKYDGIGKAASQAQKPSGS